MTHDEFEGLLDRGESLDLDWKRDFPPGLIAGSRSPGWTHGKGTVIKDIAAIANGLLDGTGHLVWGVHDRGTNRVVGGVRIRVDDADLQQWVANAIHPPIRFTFEELEHSDMTVGVATITAAPEYPHVVTRSLGGVIFEGQVWHRRGTQNTVALYDDLARMFLGDQPISDERTSGPIVTRAIAYYEAQGREARFVRWTDREGQIAEGFEYAHDPGTRRKVVVIPSGHTGPDLVLMLRPMAT